jgi:glucose/arabinose dehydrogenase
MSTMDWAATWCPTIARRCKTSAFYGWAYSYFEQNVDTRVEPPRPDLVAKAIFPDYALEPCATSLGLTSAQSTSLPPQFQHGCSWVSAAPWNRKPRIVAIR